MKFYILRVEWSQTDSEFRVVQAPSQAVAMARFTSLTKYSVTCYGEVDTIEKA
jgi:hypothetical protein